MRKLPFLIGALCALHLSSANAVTLFFHGQAKQGGTLFGYASPNAEVTLNGEKLDVRKDGWFIVGIGRDDTGFLKFAAQDDDERVEKTFKIKPVKWKVQRVNGLPQNTVTPNKAEQKRIEKEAKITQKAREKDTGSEFPLCFSLPAKGRISSVYGSQRILNGIPANQHNALDIANKEGTVIRAPADAVVLLSYDEMLLSGKTLLLGHGQNLTTSYIHMNKLFVKKGQKVKKGDQLGTIGMTGRANGPHLHWTVMWKNKRVDPQTFLNNSRSFCARTIQTQEVNHE